MTNDPYKELANFKRYLNSHIIGYYGLLHTNTFKIQLIDEEDYILLKITTRRSNLTLYNIKFFLSDYTESSLIKAIAQEIKKQTGESKFEDFLNGDYSDKQLHTSFVKLPAVINTPNKFFNWAHNMGLQ